MFLQNTNFGFPFFWLPVICQGSKLTFQPASQTRLIDCNFYQSADKLFSPPHKQKIENNEKMEQNKMPFSLIKD
jgi:hypothetical protein